jgi:N-formylglutamate deformylase
VLAAQQRFTHVVDGRFKGGWITRHYGRPQSNVHAVQLEMCWSCYLDEAAPSRWSEERAERVAPVLRNLLEAMLGWRPQ